jgi:hypothetical protein
MAVFPYRITLSTRKGEFDVDLNGSQGPEAAGRRAHLTVVHARTYGDIDQVHVVAIASVCAWFAGCDNISTGAMAHPIIGDVPICDRCRARVERAATTGHERW